MQVKVEWDMSQINAMMEKLANAGKSGTKALEQGASVIEAHAKMNAEAHGLHKTGNLIGSIQIYDKMPFSVMVGSRGVIYAAVHEFGATISPKRAKMLSWIGESGERIFAHKVVIPARPYLRPAVDENKSAVEAAIANVVKQELGA